MLKRRELIRLGVAAGVMVPGTGCATLWNLLNSLFDAPKLAITKMELLNLTLSSAKVKFLGSIANPNPIGFKLFRLDYLLKLAGGQVAKGVAPQGIELKPNGSAKTEFELDFNIAKTANAILELIEKNVVPYELNATGKFFSREGGVDVPVGFSGKMPMPDLPQITVRSFEPRGISASGVDFRVVTDVKNTMDFAIPIDKFAFNVKVDGRSILSNKSVNGMRIAAGRKEDVPIDFHVGLSALGVSLSQALSGKRMNWELNTQLKSGPLLAPFTNRGSFRLS